ncbi:hypothetical protein [Chlorogloea sp. CCALA 695]|uniref:hypothetical protein n=1 Tax=Chlorogloea sp. CCALA 695 TaxID=2107693 RepID=UPI000D0859E6|nr:hypothetical protein [Chlorogloea sp. CCALA 695]PSB30119.1 hypothetical protein C7B70_17130 [Chlorogloea sp. CCALA 695]
MSNGFYSNSAQSVYTLRQYACKIARSQWNFLYLDLRKAIEIVEKNTINKRSFNYIKRAFIDLLIVKDKSLVQKEPTVGISLELAQSAINLDISSARAAAISAIFALRLGVSHAILADKLRDLVGNPYLVIPEQIVNRNWWVKPPKARNRLEVIRYWLNSWLVKTKDREERRHFNNFMNQCVSLAEAWSSCPNPSWMLAMIDMYSSHNDVLQIENKLRQFVCYLTQQNEYCDSWRTNGVKKAIWTAERFINGKTSLKDLKIAEIAAVESIKNEGTIDYINLLGLLCTSSSPWNAAVDALRLSGERVGESDKKLIQLVQAVQLRKLIENPFI